MFVWIMVFTKVMIIKGFLLSNNDVLSLVKYLMEFMSHVDFYKFLNTDFSKYKETDKALWIIYNAYMINNLLSRFQGIQLYEWPCCTKVDDCYILGIKVKQYDRLAVRCDKCDTHTLCATCLGQTENGYYDIDRILDSVFQVDETHICKWCHNDKKATSPSCKFCNHHLLENASMKLQTEDFKDCRLHKWFDTITQTPQYFYMLDDCTSCR